MGLLAGLAGLVGGLAQTGVQASMMTAGAVTKTTGEVLEVGARDGKIPILGAAGQVMKEGGEAMLAGAGEMQNADWGARTQSAIESAASGVMERLSPDVMAAARSAVKIEGLGMGKSLSVGSTEVAAAVAPLPEGCQQADFNSICAPVTNFGGGGGSKEFGLG